MYREKLVVFSLEGNHYLVKTTNLPWAFRIEIKENENSFQICSFVSFLQNDCILSDAKSIKTIRFLAQKDGFDDIDVSIGTEDRNFEMKFDQVELDKDVFVENNSIYVKFIVSIDGLAGHQTSSVDFLRPSNCSDVVLIVEGKRLYANKGYLAMCSKYFEKLFFSNSKKTTKKEFKLEGIKWYQFHELLQQIHPGPDICHRANMKYLLELAHQFEIPRVVDDFKLYFLRNSKLDILEKLEYADKYNMFDVLGKFVKELKSDHILEMRDCIFFDNITQQTKDALIDRAMFLDAVEKKKQKRERSCSCDNDDDSF